MFKASQLRIRGGNPKDWLPPHVEKGPEGLLRRKSSRQQGIGTTPQSSLKQVCALCVAIITATLLYLDTLRAHPLAWYTEPGHLGQIAISALTSLTIFLIVVTTLVTPSGACLRLSPRMRGGLLVFTLASLAAALLWDRGETLDHHGLFNCICFLAVYLPVQGLLLLGVAGWRALGGRRCLKGLCAMAALATLVLAPWSARASRAWLNGLAGEAMDAHRMTCPVPRVIPWIELLPPGALNSWAGKVDCHPNALGPPAFAWVSTSQVGP
ncbi:hypothetical protein CYMTET_39406 [Cymbomonas tetramitiformis]|uniref:Uncharacterized protein n=1 Tax=Cymbomonas tetramitiformis TaxID=36881 RepID=A0AAE0CCD2_9CHLO|nr:hypothetical protein CYMTET_39406 [Cymbomonas tetramitiformis]